MRYVYTPHKYWPVAFARIKAMKRPYTTKETGSSRIVCNDRAGYLASDQFLGGAIRGHMAALKREIYTAAEGKSFAITEQAPYCLTSEYFNSELPTRRLYVSEFDLSSAYWTTANRLALISDATYNKFLRFKTKRFRLMGLGSLAKRELVRQFDENGVQLSNEVKVNKLGQEIFRYIAACVAMEMFKLSELYTQAFLFYWADNFISLHTLQKIETPYAVRVNSPLEMRFLYARSRFVFSIDKRTFSLPLSSLRQPLYDVPF